MAVHKKYKSMRILHVVFSMQIGGIESMLVDILNLQVSTNNDVALLIINQDYNRNLLLKIDKRVSVFYINRKKVSKNVLSIINLNYIVYRYKPDILHFHDNNARRIVFYRKAIRVLTVHDVGILINNLHKFDCICAISNSVKEDLMSRYGISSKLIYNGINLNEVRIKAISEHSSSDFRILQISRLNHFKKGQDVLIQALYILKQKIALNISIDFIGEGESLQHLQELVSAYNLENSVRFLGLKNRDYVYQNICNYSLLVQPSNYEGFGLTVVEGMAAKIPIMVSDNDGPMEIIQGGKYGFYFKKGNAESCAESILSITNTENMNVRIERAYNYAIENFNIKKTVASYIDLYEEEVNKKLSKRVIQ